MASMSSQVARILYKEIVGGDIRKINAQSNDANTGGGARDFRFGSFTDLLPVIKKMFPETVMQNRRRGGQTIAFEVFKGEFYWEDSQGQVQREDSFFESPTDVRPSEGRIVRVSEYGCFATSRIPKGGADNRVLLLFIQLYDDSVWPFFAEERTFRVKGKWDAAVAKELLSCLDASRPENRVVIGYYDFTNASRYCNGK